MPNNDSGALPPKTGRLKLNAALTKIDLKEQLDVEKQGKLRVLVLEEGKQLVAQCLNFDFAVHGADIPELKHRLAHVLASHVLLSREFKKLPFDVGQAPSVYFSAWEKASRKIVPTTEISPPAASDSVASYWTEAVERAEFAILP